MKLTFDVEDKPKFGQLIVFAVQQMLAILAATIAVPAIVGNGLTPAAAMFGAGCGTLVYQLFTRRKSPVFLGSSFAFLGSMFSAFAGGVSMQLGAFGLILGAALAGIVYVIIALLVKVIGVKWLNKLMPAVIIGPTVAIIGLSLAGNAIGDLKTTDYVQSVDVSDMTIIQDATLDANGEVISSGGYSVQDNDAISVSVDEDGKFQGSTKPGSPYVAIICGLITLATVMLCSTYGKKMLKLIPFIIGILAGYAAASIFTIIGEAANIDSLKIIDFSVFSNYMLKDGQVGVNTFFSVPNLIFLDAAKGASEFSMSYFWTIFAAYVPVALVVFAEHVADHKNLSSIIGRDLLEKPGLSNTLLGDGIGSMVGAFFGGCPNTTYGESIGCVAITGNASTRTITAAAIGCIIFSFITPLVAFVDSIPACVMGGVCVALYGFIAVSGLKMLQSVNLDENRNLFVASVILIAGIGGFSVSFGAITITEVAAALILGILANAMLSKQTK